MSHVLTVSYVTVLLTNFVRQKFVLTVIILYKACKFVQYDNSFYGRAKSKLREELERFVHRSRSLT